MSKLKNFFNQILNDNRIFTAEDIGDMSGDEFIANENAINYQMKNLGIPRRNELVGNPDVVYVHSYTKSDGTKVKAHYRTKPDGIESNNLSFIGTLTGAAANADFSQMFYNPQGYVNNIPQKYKDPNYGLNENLFKLNASYWNNNILTNIINGLLFSQDYIKNKIKLSPKEILGNLSFILYNPMPISAENFRNAIYYLKTTEQNPNAHVINSRSLLSNKLNQTLDNIKVPKNARGVYFDKNSKQSNNLWNSLEIQNFINNHILEIYNNKNSGTYTLEFTSSIDAFAGIQHCKLVDPHITSNGYFDAWIIDYYDFTNRKIKSFKDYKNIINDFGYILQEIKYLENYFLLYHIYKKIGE